MKRWHVDENSYFTSRRALASSSQGSSYIQLSMLLSSIPANAIKGHGQVNEKCRGLIDLEPAQGPLTVQGNDEAAEAAEAAQAVRAVETLQATEAAEAAEAAEVAQAVRAVEILQADEAACNTNTAWVKKSQIPAPGTVDARATPQHGWRKLPRCVLDAALEKIGKKAVEVGGGGLCMLYSITAALAIQGESGIWNLITPQYVLDLIADWLLANQTYKGGDISLHLSAEDNYEGHVSPEDKKNGWEKYCSGVKNRKHQGNELWIIAAVNVFRRPIRIVSSYSCGKVTCRTYTLRDGNVTRVDHAPGVLFSSQETTAAPGNEPMNLLQYMGDTFSAGHYRVLVDDAVEPLLREGFFSWMS